MKNLFGRENKHKLISVLVVLAVLVSLPALEWLPELLGGARVLATAEHEKIKNDAENELNDVNDEIDRMEDDKQELEDEIAYTKKKRKKLEKKIQDTNDELEQVLSELEDLGNQIVDKQDEIEQAAAALIVAQEELDAEYDAMKLRIQFMYENNQQDSFWAAILEADGLVDMLTRVEYMADVYASDRKLMNQFSDTLHEVEDLNVKLAEEMAALVVLQAQVESKQDELEDKLATLEEDEEELASMLSEMETLQRTYKKQLAAYEERKGELKATIEREDEIIRRLEAEAARANANTYEGGGSGASNTFGSAEYLTDDSYNPSPVTDVLGTDVVEYALKFVGNPYKWGGNSLTNGCDCSGFVHLIYEHFGIDTPRYSQSFKLSGQPVSFNNMQPGDVVVYDGHVAIYMGDGKIVEAQSTKAGITDTRPVGCHKITAIRRLV